MPSFLSPLLREPDRPFRLRCAASGRTIATRLEGAFDSAARRRGLLGRTGLPDGTALVIAPCSSVHTWFMKFALDLVFASRDGRVVGVRRQVRPWRIAGAWGAFAVFELAGGSLPDDWPTRSTALVVEPSEPAI